jgi:hypothetical protein
MTLQELLERIEKDERARYPHAKRAEILPLIAAVRVLAQLARNVEDTQMAPGGEAYLVMDARNALAAAVAALEGRGEK